MKTIRSRMIIIILGVIAASGITQILLTQSQTRTQINSLMDQRAEYMADTLLVILEGETMERGTSGLVPQAEGVRGPVHHYESEPPFPFQLWIEEELRARTIATPDFGLPNRDTPLWQELTVDGAAWRVLTLYKAIQSERRGGNVNAWAVIGIQKRDLELLVDNLVWRSIWPLFVSLPLLVVIVFFGIGIGLKPLRVLAEQVGRRTPNQLNPITVDHTPGEVIPLIGALNHLFEEVQRAFENEKRFTADAAHELRTPMCALSAQAQVALEAKDDTSRDKALRQITSGVDRLNHLVSQLLELARLDPKNTVKGEVVDLLRLTQETMADLSNNAIEKHQDFSMSRTDSASIHGDPVLLGTMIRNLLDNALSYTPENGIVEVSVSDDGVRTQITISDTGPGIPIEIRSNVFRRFFRGNTNNEYGTGLGLSIVDRIASLHNASIQILDNNDPGLTIVVTFPNNEIDQPAR